MLTRKFLVTAIAGLWLAAWGVGSAGAQTVDKSLKGVGNFELLIEELDDDSATCGITKRGIARAVKKGAKGAPFKIGGENYNLYVNVLTLPRDGNCFSSVRIQAYYYGEVVLPNYPKGNFAEVALWENGTITITGKSEHGKDVNKWVTELTRKLVEDWEQDNS